MPTNNNSCFTPLQRSLAWCQGQPVMPGIRRRLYYTSKQNVVQWPAYSADSGGRYAFATTTGNFTLKADTYWHFIDILAEKSTLTSDAQGEAPSQTQLNKLTAVHPGVGQEASAVACYLNNSDNVFLVQDMSGLWRIVGSRFYETKTTVAQDNGQGATGTASTTINVEATDICPSPFYQGTIVTEDGELSLAGGDTPTAVTT
ncbi:MAG: hypothetical protein IJQ60_02760 [Prevotella sp.]|nr:hypothetical protein [Prevotella sp.]